MQYKTRLELIFYIKLTLCTIMLFFLISGGLWAYGYVLRPSYLSVSAGCNEQVFDRLFSQGMIAGVFTSGSKNKSKDGIKIYTPSKYDDSWQGRNEYKATSEYSRTMKHEQIHQRQYKRDILFGCNHKVLKYFGEIHAYVGEWF